MSNTLIIVDSSALVAIAKADDADHQKATSLNNQITKHPKSRLLILHEVLAETLNIIGKKMGKNAAATVGNTILLQYAADELEFISSNIAIITQALQLQVSASGSSSFIDCLVMAHADQQRTPYIFGFDDTFAKNGYQLPK